MGYSAFWPHKKRKYQTTLPVTCEQITETLRAFCKRVKKQ